MRRREHRASPLTSKTDVRGGTDPFMLATTSVVRASAIGLEGLEILEELERLEPLEEPENQRLEGCRNTAAALFLSKHQKKTHPKAPKIPKNRDEK